MSDSEDDMFLSQRDVRPPRTEVQVPVSRSQPQKSDVEYLWNLAFHWDIGDRNPFTLQPICNFTEAEVPSTWYMFKLRDELRLKKIDVRILSGLYSIFCKVEKGIFINLYRFCSSFITVDCSFQVPARQTEKKSLKV